MKKILKFTMLSAVLLMLAGGLTSCKEKEKETIVTMIVSNDTEWRLNATSGLPQEYVRTTEVGFNEVTYMWPSLIEGFQYERGFEYVLKVKKTRIDPPWPMDDFYPHNYSLVEIISKTEKPLNSESVGIFTVYTVMQEVEGEKRFYFNVWGEGVNEFWPDRVYPSLISGAGIGETLELGFEYRLKARKTRFEMSPATSMQFTNVYSVIEILSKIEKEIVDITTRN